MDSWSGTQYCDKKFLA